MAKTNPNPLFSRNAAANALERVMHDERVVDFTFRRRGSQLQFRKPLTIQGHSGGLDRPSELGRQVQEVALRITVEPFGHLIDEIGEDQFRYIFQPLGHNVTSSSNLMPASG